MEQLGLAGMPRRLFACTPSRLGSWLDCPRRYRMTYLDRPAPAKGPPWAHNSLGAAVHNALREWWLLPHPQRTPAVGRRLVDRQWLSEGFRDHTQSDSWRERAGAMVEGYLASIDARDEPLAVERTVAARTGALALRGRIDRLDRRGEGLVVVDYKTGRHVLSTDDARGSLALALYAVAVSSTLRERCRRVELHHLPTGRVLVWEHTDGSLARQVARAEAVAAEASTAEHRWRAGHPTDADFPAKPGPQCGWCDVAMHCPVGLAAAPRRRSWDGLAHLEAADDGGAAA